MYMWLEQIYALFYFFWKQISSPAPPVVGQALSQREYELQEGREYEGDRAEGWLSFVFIDEVFNLFPITKLNHHFQFKV